MIRDIYIAGHRVGEPANHEPPSCELNVSTAGEEVHLAIVEVDEQGNRSEHGNNDIIVSAKSLAAALEAAKASDG